jgi:hypothetical protein
MTSPTSELVGPMGRHERIAPRFAQKKLHRSDGRGACMHPRGCFDRFPDVSGATLRPPGDGGQGTVTCFSKRFASAGFDSYGHRGFDALFTHEKKMCSSIKVRTAVLFTKGWLRPPLMRCLALLCAPQAGLHRSGPRHDRRRPEKAQAPKTPPHRTSAQSRLHCARTLRTGL